MLLRLLGTAAGGGLPQWNCACPGCVGARIAPSRRRRHASLAVRAHPGSWFIVNATPDIGDQIEATEELWPGPEPRRTPLTGVILTDAELDHTLGIARLREADAITVYATTAVRSGLLTGLRLGDTLGPYTDLTWRDLTPGATTSLGEGSIEIETVPISGKRPRYAASFPADDAWVVALRFKDRETGKVAVYAPALGVWSKAFDDAVQDADCVIMDGTFWDDDEPRRTEISAKTATEMGHLPIHGPGGTATRLSSLRARCLYTHLNNTNPLGDPDAPQFKLLDDLGVEVASDGMVIEL